MQATIQRRRYMPWYRMWFVSSLKGSFRKRLSLFVVPSCTCSFSTAKRPSDVVASATAVVGTARRVASVVAATTGTSLTVTGAVVFLLDDDGVAITMVPVNEKGKKLERHQYLAARIHTDEQLTKVVKKKMMFMMARAKQALSIAHVLLM